MGLKYGSLLAHHSGLALGVAWAFLAGRRRSLLADATRVVSLMDPPPRFENQQLVPPRDAFLLVANHFQSPQWWVGWSAAAISGAVAQARESGQGELHWTVISEWRWFEVAGVWVPNPMTSLLFPRACQVWGLIAMPPRPGEVAGRARALREMLSYLGLRPGGQHRAPEPVGLFPEGRATFALEEAMPGTGAFLHRISSLGVPLLPAGVHQQGDALKVVLGRPFLLGDPPAQWQGDLDGWARTEVMVAIGRLLPPPLWGVYAEAIAEAS